jgi:hypothetical protein
VGGAAPKKPAKYYNKKVTLSNGMKFDSIREAERYQELSLMERAGVIRELECQHKIPLTANGNPVTSKKNRKLSYWVDFKYWDIENERWRYEDVKGYDTPLSSLKVAVVEAESGGSIIVEIVR